MNIEEENKLFFGKLASIYDHIFGNWIIGIQRKVIQQSKILKKARVLDAGCGTGNFLSLLEKYPVRAYGIDISKQMLAVAKMKLNRVNIKLSSVERVSFPKGFFDYVFTIDAFHHFSDKKKAMENFHRLLKKKGILVVVDVDFGSFLNRVFQRLEPGNNGILGRKEIKNIFKLYNFKVIKQINVGLFTFMTISKFCSR